MYIYGEIGSLFSQTVRTGGEKRLTNIENLTVDMHCLIHPIHS